MKPIGPLMIEHRLIERVVALVKRELLKIEETREIDYVFMENIVDFFRMYVDRTHHGKEEAILFRSLSSKQLSAEHGELMKGLIEDHIRGRRLVSDIGSAGERYRQGDPGALKKIVACFGELVSLYPAHIEKEDKQFFYPCLNYLSEQEQDDMLLEFWEFDRKLIHERYRGLVERLEGQRVQSGAR